MRFWGGPTCTELPFPVCKTGYRPFDAQGNRLYGCSRHSELRAQRIAKAGGALRPGWQSFTHPAWDPAAESTDSEDAAES